MIWPTACATAHRGLPDEQWPWVRAELKRIARKLRDGHRTRMAWSGMAMGGDLEWGEVVVDMPYLDLGACIPFKGQTETGRWPKEQKARWQRLVDEAADIHVVGDLTGVPTAKRSARANQLYHARNTAMLMRSQVLVAVLDLTRANDHSGTYTTYVSARDKLHLPIIRIDPAGGPGPDGVEDPDKRTRLINAPVAMARL